MQTMIASKTMRVCRLPWLDIVSCLLRSRACETVRPRLAAREWMHPERGGEKTGRLVAEHLASKQAWRRLFLSCPVKVQEHRKHPENIVL